MNQFPIRRRRQLLWAAIGVLMLPVAYAASYGPAYSAWQYGLLPGRFFTRCYLPLTMSAHRVGLLRMLDRYVELWPDFQGAESG